MFFRDRLNEINIKKLYLYIKKYLFEKLPFLKIILKYKKKLGKRF